MDGFFALAIDNPGFGNILEIVVCPSVSFVHAKEATAMDSPDGPPEGHRSPERRSSFVSFHTAYPAVKTAWSTTPLPTQGEHHE